MLFNILCVSRDITADIAIVEPAVNFEEQQEPEASLEHDEM